MADKVCAACGVVKNKLLEFSIRQQSKKFGRCNQCLEPTYSSQRYMPTPSNVDRCKRCQDALTSYNTSLTDNSICGRCASLLAGRKFSRESRAEYSKQIEDKALAKKYKQKKLKEDAEEMVWNIAGDGIGTAYDDGKILFRAVD